MDQSQTKALAAIQPFVYQVTTTKSPTPRFIAELIKGAISAPGAYVFTELLQLPAVQALRGTEAEVWLTLLEIFSWGTYAEYEASSNLPSLDAPQALKLRQLTLLTLASPVTPRTTSPTTNNLTYASLLASLSLSSPAELESLITTSIYSNLLTARLSPASNPPSVHITSVAPLRDLRPHSLPALLQILQTWESRCVSVASDLEAQIAAIRATASQRAIKEKNRQDLVDNLVLSNEKSSPENGARSRAAGQRVGSKRDLDQHNDGEDDDYEEEYEGMDLDEGIGGDTSGGVAGMGSRGGGSSRGAKRNRGRGSK